MGGCCKLVSKGLFKETRVQGGVSRFIFDTSRAHLGAKYLSCTRKRAIMVSCVHHLKIRATPQVY